jgi:hypothetical protein
MRRQLPPQPQGKERGKRKGNFTLLLSNKEKKAKKELMTMVVNDLKSSLGQSSKRKPKEKDDGSDDDIYDLVRGKKSSMIIQGFDSGEREYLPRRGVIMMDSSGESEDSDYTLGESFRRKKRKIKMKKKNYWTAMRNLIIALLTVKARKRKVKLKKKKK